MKGLLRWLFNIDRWEFSVTLSGRPYKDSGMMRGFSEELTAKHVADWHLFGLEKYGDSAAEASLLVNGNDYSGHLKP